MMTDQEQPIPETTALRHRGPEHSAPYPMSRLAPAFDGSDLAAEVAKAEAMLGARTQAKLSVIAERIKALRWEAKRILAEAQEEQSLNQAQCAFKRVPGKTYHLYRQRDGRLAFSMLSPGDWGGRPPRPYLGSYRLEADYAWTRIDSDAPRGDQDDATTGPAEAASPPGTRLA